MNENLMSGGRRWVVTAGVGLIALVLVGTIVAVLGGRDDDLPAPRTLGRDPVPAERTHAIMPANCGVGAATREALTPDARIDEDGSRGKCEWWASATESVPDRGLSVTLSAVPPGPATGQEGSPVAAAMTNFANVARQAQDARPIAGLGDEAYSTPGYTGAWNVVFRTGDLTATVEYRSEGYPDDGPHTTLPTERLRDGALRAAADVARHLGAPTRPRATTAAKVSSSVSFPQPMCRLVPEDLQERLVGDDPGRSSANGDPTAGPDVAWAHAEGCSLLSSDRELSVAVTAATVSNPALAMPDADRDYTRRYLQARAEQPISTRDERYFHALSGLGDRAFCTYLEEGRLPGRAAENPARVVVRVGPAVLTITYGSVRDDESEPLTREEAVNGAYAAAVSAARYLRKLT